MLMAAAKLLQSCLTLCDPIDSSPPGFAIPGILQARTLEWVAISFSNASKWKVKVKLLSRVRLFATPWTVAHQAPLSMGFSRQEYWSGVLLPSPMLMAALFIIANIWKQSICPLMTMDKKCVIHTHTHMHTHTHNGILFSHKKRMKSCHLWQHWWTSGHYAKLNKSDREWQIPHDLSYLWKSEKKLINTENRLVVARGQAQEK